MPEFIPKARYPEDIARRAIELDASAMYTKRKGLVDLLGTVGGKYIERKDKEIEAEKAKKEKQIVLTEEQMGDLVKSGHLEMDPEILKNLKPGESMRGAIKRWIPMSERMAGAYAPDALPVSSDLANEIYRITGIFPKTMGEAKIATTHFIPKDGATQKALDGIQKAMYGGRTEEGIAAGEVTRAVEETEASAAGMDVRGELLKEAKKRGVSVSALPQKIRDEVITRTRAARKPGAPVIPPGVQPPTPSPAQVSANDEMVGGLKQLDAMAGGMISYSRGLERVKKKGGDEASYEKELLQGIKTKLKWDDVKARGLVEHIKINRK